MITAILIVGQHFIFDWILQPRWVAVNKSKNNKALAAHGLLVTFGFGLVAATVYSVAVATGIALLYGLLHIIQDRIIWSTFKPKTNNPYEEKMFWNTVAVDQTIHLVLALVLIGIKT